MAQDSVLSQLRDDIELLLSDNASVDGTEELMKEYCEKYLITYVRNPENIGSIEIFRIVMCMQYSDEQVGKRIANIRLTEDN